MHKGNSIVTIIPARSGSKSLHKKNIRLLGNRPLIAYSIEYSLKCKIVDRTIVSTDDKETAQIAKRYGAEVPFFRPKKYAQDTSRDFSFMMHSALWLKKNENFVPNFLVLLRPTSPFRPKGLIERGISMLIETKNADSIRSVALCDEHPYKMWKVQGNFMKPLAGKNIYEPYNLPRQLLPKIYYQTGDLEIVRSSTLFKKRSVSGDNIIPLIIDKKKMIDIDDLKDFEKAESKTKKS